MSRPCIISADLYSSGEIGHATWKLTTVENGVLLFSGAGQTQFNIGLTQAFWQTQL